MVLSHRRLSMASLLIPRCTLIKPHLETRGPRIALGSTVSLRAAARMESSTLANATALSAEGTESSAADTVVQYVVVRRDLIDTWPLGSYTGLPCLRRRNLAHKDDSHTFFYCSPSNLDSMHKASDSTSN